MRCGSISSRIKNLYGKIIWDIWICGRSVYQGTFNMHPSVWSLHSHISRVTVLLLVISLIISMDRPPAGLLTSWCPLALKKLDRPLWLSSQVLRSEEIPSVCLRETCARCRTEVFHVTISTTSAVKLHLYLPQERDMLPELNLKIMSDSLMLVLK